MPDLLAVAPPTPTSDIERRKLEAMRSAEAASFTDAIGAAYAQTTPANMVRQLARADIEANSDWTLTRDSLDQLTQGIDRDLWTGFEKANSEESARLIRQQLLDVTNYRRQLESRGWQGTALQLAAAVTDPVYMLAGMLTGGAATAATTAGRFGRIGSVVRSGLIASAPMAAIDAYNASQNPAMGGSDIGAAAAGGFGFGAAASLTARSGRVIRALAGGVGMAAPTVIVDAIAADEDEARDLRFSAATSLLFGGVFNAIHPTRRPDSLAVGQQLHDAAEDMLRDVQHADLQGVTLSAKGDRYFARQTSEATAARTRRITEAAEATLAADEAHLAELDPAEIVSIEARATEDPAALATPTAPQRELGDLDLSSVSDAPSRVGAGRIGMADRAGNSPVPFIRRLSRMLGRDVIPAKDGAPVTFSAAEWADSTVKAYRARQLTFADAQHAQHVEAQRAAGQKPLTRAEFSQRVSKAQRRRDYGGEADNSVRATADHNRKLYAELHSLARRQGVKAFSRFESRPEYVPRLPVRAKIDDAISTFGLRNVRELVIGSVQDASGAPRDIAEAVADSWIRNAGSRRQGEPSARILDDDQTDALIEQLRKSNPDMSEDELRNFVEGLGPDTMPTVNTPSRAKQRVLLNETRRGVMRDDLGNPMGELGIEDLLENDADTIFASYAQQIVGASALAEVYRAASGPGERISTLDQLLRKAQNSAVEAGLSRQQYVGDLKRLEVLAKLAGGIPLSEDSATTVALRSLRNLQYVRTMSNAASGVRNLAEFSHALSTVGLRATLKQLPALGDIIQRAADGQLNNALSRELELMGLGVERITFRPLRGVSTGEGYVTPQGVIERWTHRAARAAGDVSGQNVGTIWMQKAVGKLVSQRLADEFASARPGQTLSDFRLAATGLTREMGERIGAQIRAHATYTKGRFGRLTAFNFEAWTDDLEAATALRQAIVKTTNRLILSPSQSELPRWMTTETGKLIGQLRTYSTSGWRTKMGFELEARDATAARNLVIASAATIPTYVVGVLIDSIGREDPQAYIRQRLAPGEIAKAVIARNTFASLIPTALDIGSEVTRGQPLFSNIRSSGVRSYGAGGIPTVDWAASTWDAITAAAEGDELDREDIKAISNALFVPRLPGLRQALERMAE